MDINLPQRATMEGAELSQLKWLVFGMPGIGKSTYFSKAADRDPKTGAARTPLFLFTDPGLKFIKVHKKPIMSWDQFKGLVKAIMDPAQKVARRHSMIVLDTADLLFRMCRTKVVKARGIEHVSDEQWGKGYDLVRDEFEQCVALLARWCDDSLVGLAFISHAKDINIKGRSVQTNRLVPTLPKQAHDIIAPLCDVIGYAGFSDDKADRLPGGEMGRIIQFEPDETVEAKDRTGALPARCRLDFDVVRTALGGGEDDEEGGTAKGRQEDVD